MLAIINNSHLKGLLVVPFALKVPAPYTLTALYSCTNFVFLLSVLQFLETGCYHTRFPVPQDSIFHILAQ